MELHPYHFWPHGVLMFVFMMSLTAGLEKEKTKINAPLRFVIALWLGLTFLLVIRLVA